MEPIHLFEPLHRTAECLAAVGAVLDSGWTAPGAQARAFERAWCEYTGLPHAHFVSSATVGLQLALEAIRARGGAWRGRSTILSTPLTFVATNHAALRAGLDVRFADVDDTGCLSYVSALSRMSSVVSGVMFVGLGGRLGHLEAVAELCRDRNRALIVDGAHMAGTLLPSGLVPDAIVYSFQSVKNLSTGDGGMVCLKDPEDDAFVRRYSWLGIDRSTYDRSTAESGGYRWRYDVRDVGLKGQGNDIAAALGLVGLKYLDADNRRRRQIAQLYDEKLQTWAMPGDAETNSQHLYQVRVPNGQRDRVLAELAANQIFTGVHYVSNTRYPMYRKQPETPRAEALSDALLSLPMHCRLTDGDAERVRNATHALLLEAERG